MAGRLEKYQGQVQKSQYHVQQKLPLKKSDQKQNKKKLKADNINLVFKLSKENKLICVIFYSNPSREKAYRFCIIPEKRMLKRTKMYIQVIDVKAQRRKLFRRDRIINAKLTDKTFTLNQNMILYKK